MEAQTSNQWYHTCSCAQCTVAAAAKQKATNAAPQQRMRRRHHKQGVFATTRTLSRGSNSSSRQANSSNNPHEEHHLDGRDLVGAQKELVAPVSPLAERVFFQDYPAPPAPQQVMRDIFSDLKAVDAFEQPFVIHQLEPPVRQVEPLWAEVSIRTVKDGR